MKLIIQTPQAALNKAYLKQKVLKSDILKFTSSLNLFYNKIDPNESEENQKNHIRDLLIEIHYKNQYEINTKDNIDLAIFTDNLKKKVGVIIEVKKPSNKIFDYQPRFYDPEKDPVEQRKRKLGFRKSQNIRKKNKSPFLWLVIFLIIAFVYLKLTGFIR